MAVTLWSKRTGERIDLEALTAEDVNIGPDDLVFSLTPVVIKPPAPDPRLAAFHEARRREEMLKPIPVDPKPGADWRDLI